MFNNEYNPIGFKPEKPIKKSKNLNTRIFDTLVSSYEKSIEDFKALYQSERNKNRDLSNNNDTLNTELKQVKGDLFNSRNNVYSKVKIIETLEEEISSLKSKKISNPKTKTTKSKKK